MEPTKKVGARLRDVNFSRLSAVDNIERAFQFIGGVDRLTLWANENPEKFFTQMYPKLLPSTSLNINGDNTRLEIIHALPPTELDAHANHQQLSAETALHALSPEGDKMVDIGGPPPLREDSSGD